MNNQKEKLLEILGANVLRQKISAWQYSTSLKTHGIIGQLYKCYGKGIPVVCKVCDETIEIVMKWPKDAGHYGNPTSFCKVHKYNNKGGE